MPAHFSLLAYLVHIRPATKEDGMKYVVKYSGAEGGYREAVRQLAALRAARRELQAARRALRCRA
jgi:hypothetical protein